MVVKGFQRVSLIDYPGKIAAVVFTSGCNFRCPYCHNRDLVLNPNSLETVPEEEIFEYLKKRKGLIEGVCITGGEPTLQEDLFDFVGKIKRLRLLVKLDTNGSNPSALEHLIAKDLIDYVALDVKAPLDERYVQSVGIKRFDPVLILSSVKALVRSKIDYELRTTIVPPLHKKKDLVDMAAHLSSLTPHSLLRQGYRGQASSLKWYLQQFQPGNCLNLGFEEIRPYSRAELEELLVSVRKYMPETELRGA